MSYVQVEDALRSIRAHYQELTSSLKRIPPSDKRLPVVARRVEKAERRMKKALASFENTASEGTLQTWLQFFPEDELAQLHTEYQGLESVSEFLDYYRRFSQKLVELFDLVGRETECEACSEIFELLGAAEQQNARDLGWAVRAPV